MTRSRRAFLRTGLVAGSVGLAGCAISPFPEPDESIHTSPPGDPPLDPGGEWPTYRYDAGNTGANPDGAGVRDPERYWRLDANIRESTVGNGRLANRFVGSSGTLTIREPTTATVQQEVELDRGGGSGRPVFGMGLVVAATYGELIAVDAATGEIRWRQTDIEAIVGSPSIHDERVVVTTHSTADTSGALHTFREDGTRRWRYDDVEEPQSTPAIADGTVFVVGTEGLHAVDVDTGERVFRISNVTNPRKMLAVADGTIYVSVTSDDGPTELIAIGTTDGSIRWRTEIGAGAYDPPVVTHEAVYVYGSEEILAVTSTDGSELASTQIRAHPVGLVGDVLYAVANGTLYAYDVTADLEVLWSYTTEDVRIQDTTGRRIYGITPVGDAIYVAARDAFHGIGPAR